MPRFALRRFLVGALALGEILWGIASPLRAQIPVGPPPRVAQAAGQRTEIYLYVEKSASAATRDVARSILASLDSAPPPGSTRVTVRSFAGEHSTSTVATYPLAPGVPSPIDAVLQAATLGAPSRATIDLLDLIRHLEATAGTLAHPPVGPERVFFFVVGDFAHAPLTDVWRERGAQALAQLRQVVAANQNVHLIAIQAPPAGAIPDGPYRSVTTELAKSFLFFDDFASGQQEIAGLLSDATTPLVLQLSPRPDRNQIGFQISNPSFSVLDPIVYRARGDAVAPAAIATNGPLRLDPGTGGVGGIDLAVLQPFVPAAGCVNVWIEADGLDPKTRAVIRRGTAPQPILLGNCVDLTRAVYDLEPKRRLDPTLLPWRRFEPPRPNPQTFLGLSFRGHLQAPAATVTWDQVNASDQVLRRLGEQTIRSDRFNSDAAGENAFDGALREAAAFGWPSLADRRRLCLAGRDDEPARIRASVSVGATLLAQAVLLRKVPQPGDLIPRSPWPRGGLTLLLLLGLGLLVAYELRSADVGKLGHALTILALAALALFLVLQDGTSLGKTLERLFALEVEALSTLLVALFGAGYLLLFLLGYFDRCPSARESLRRALERRLASRLAGRRRRTFAVTAAIFVLLALTLFAILYWRVPVEECRFEYAAEATP